MSLGADSEHLLRLRVGSFPIRPKLTARAYRRFLGVCSSLAAEIQSEGHAGATQKVRKNITSSVNSNSTGDLKGLLAAHVVLDLAAQGWTVQVSNEAVTVDPPTGLSKEQIRQGHLLERDAYLREPAVREFIYGMERRRLTSNGWRSIYSLMRDGAELSEALKIVAAMPEEERAAALRTVIDPYLQFVEQGAKCEHTGLFLSDIWRYFRLTWVNTHKSVPGRSMMILIRDAAAPNHPVIGIAALASAVVQQSIRDEWIGWDAKKGVQRLVDSVKDPLALLDRIASEIADGVYVKDLKKNKLVRDHDLKNPSQEAIDRLRKEAEHSIKRHRRNPEKEIHKGSQENEQLTNSDWEAKASSQLFRSKRCRILASLLSIRLVVKQELAKRQPDTRKNVVLTPQLRHAAGQLVRMLKGERVGINMMDITVCGAIAPYNDLLGGKLVCLLLCSSEVTKHYQKRYGTQPSVIASCMKGSAVIRTPQLVLLCTTSLYGTGSSQYNRIKLPAELAGGKAGTTISYQELGVSRGYGSYHFSKYTLELVDQLLGRSRSGQRVNSIFGEGVNPRMRKIREALTLVNLPSDDLLLHRNSRIVYGIPLTSNFREFLLGLHAKPIYLLPQATPQKISSRLADYWIQRWLSKRILIHEVLERVSEQTLNFPIRHAAQVPIQEDGDALSLWSQIDS